MRLDEIDLTGEEYKNYSYYGFDDTALIEFDSTEIIMNSRDFDKLKEDIIKQNGLAKVEFNVANDAEEPPKRETLLKELRKTIDKIVDLTTRYDSTYFALMEERVSPRFIDVLEVKDELRPMLEKRNKLMRYKEELEAQLKYGEFQ